MQDSNSKAVRVISYDLMRIIAILAVITVHSSAPLVMYSPTGSIEFFVGNILDSVSRFGVPLFVMLSGALMLDEAKNITKEHYKRYILRLLLLLYSWSLIYAVIYDLISPLVLGEEISVIQFLDTFFTGYFHLWYLFMTLGLYLLTPLLRKVLKKENRGIIFPLLVIAIICRTAVPVLDFFLVRYTEFGGFLPELASLAEFDMISEYLIYYVLGWYITNTELTLKKRTVIYISGFIGLLMTVACVSLFSTDAKRAYGVFYSSASINVLLYTLAVFVFLNSILKNRISPNTEKALTRLSALAFGVYVIHPMIQGAFELLISLEDALSESALIWALTLFMSFSTTFLLSKIPLLKKLVKN